MEGIKTEGDVNISKVSDESGISEGSLQIAIDNDNEERKMQSAPNNAEDIARIHAASSIDEIWAVYEDLWSSGNKSDVQVKWMISKKLDETLVPEIKNFTTMDEIKAIASRVSVTSDAHKALVRKALELTGYTFA